jgi:hypothetical protein
VYSTASSKRPLREPERLRADAGPGEIERHHRVAETLPLAPNI